MTTTQIRQSYLEGPQNIHKPLGGIARRTLHDVVVCEDPILDHSGFGHCATATVRLWGEVVPVVLRCVVVDGKFGTFGWGVS